MAAIRTVQLEHSHNNSKALAEACGARTNHRILYKEIQDNNIFVYLVII